MIRSPPPNALNLPGTNTWFSACCLASSSSVPRIEAAPGETNSDTAAPASENAATTRKTPRESRHSPTPPAPNATTSLSR